MSARHDDFRDDWRASKPAHEAAVRASDWTIAYADSPSFVQARADDDLRRAVARIPTPKPSAIGKLIARQQNRRLYVLRMLRDRARLRRMGLPTHMETYALRCILDPTYAAASNGNARRAPYALEVCHVRVESYPHGASRARLSRAALEGTARRAVVA